MPTPHACTRFAARAIALSVLSLASLAACGRRIPAGSVDASLDTSADGVEAAIADASPVETGLANPDAGDACPAGDGASPTGLVTMISWNDMNFGEFPSLAVDANALYLSHSAGPVSPRGPTGLIVRLPLCGAPPETIASGNIDPVDIALAGGSVYWTDNGGFGDDVFLVSAGGGAVTPVNPNPDGLTAGGLAVDATNVYFTANAIEATVTGYVFKVPLGGGTPTTLYEGAPTGGSSGVPGPSSGGILVNGGNLYWITTNETKSSYDIVKMPVDGGAITTLATSESIDLIATDGESIYWQTYTFTGSNTYGMLMKVSVDGGTPPVTVATGFEPGVGVAVDDQYVYWTGYNDGDVRKILKGGGGSPIILATEQGTPTSIVVDATSVYWATDTAVMRLTPK
jgi:hypothetical protein